MLSDYPAHHIDRPGANHTRPEEKLLHGINNTWVEPMLDQDVPMLEGCAPSVDETWAFGTTNRDFGL